MDLRTISSGKFNDNWNGWMIVSDSLGLCLMHSGFAESRQQFRRQFAPHPKHSRQMNKEEKVS
jgi:hypothetical protein